jgi:hypothetical protein
LSDPIFNQPQQQPRQPGLVEKHHAKQSAMA